MKLFKKSVAVLLCLVLAILTGCTTQKTEDNVYFGKSFPVYIDTDVVAEECYLYDGAFVEDGSFEEKQGVVALKVTNTGEKDIQLLRIYATTSEKELFFEITTLPAGATVTVLEKNAQTITKNEKLLEFRAENRVDFNKKLSLYENIFILQANNGTINIKNISEKDIDTDIFVYYKKKEDDGNYFGGMTFRTRAAGGLGAGKIAQLPASNFNLSDSEVLFVDYAS